MLSAARCEAPCSPSFALIDADPERHAVPAGLIVAARRLAGLGTLDREEGACTEVEPDRAGSSALVRMPLRDAKPEDSGVERFGASQILHLHREMVQGERGSRRRRIIRHRKRSLACEAGVGRLVGVL